MNLKNFFMGVFALVCIGVFVSCDNNSEILSQEDQVVIAGESPEIITGDSFETRSGMSCPSYSYPLRTDFRTWKNSDKTYIKCSGYARATYTGDTDCDYELIFKTPGVTYCPSEIYFHYKSWTALSGDLLGKINARFLNGEVRILIGDGRISATGGIDYYVKNVSLEKYW